MSYADKLFKETSWDIINNGFSSEGFEVRAKWEDGTPAHTMKQFCVVHRYDLRKEFPAITVRQIYLKSCFDEILWIWQKKSNNIKDLHSKIWNQWADEEGSIGTVYGYQVAEQFRSNIVGGEYIDQIDYVRWQLKNTPFSRRIMTNLYQYHNLYTGHLDPCAYSMTYNVTNEHREDGKLTLNAILNQRSQDMLAANGWNVAQYALLLMMLAQEANMVPGILVHVIADCHIYDRHIPLVKELLDREEYPAPTVYLNPEITNFYDFTTDDLIVENYKFGEQLKNIPIAV